VVVRNMDLKEFEADMEAEARDRPALREFYTSLMAKYYLPFSFDTGDMCAIPRRKDRPQELCINLMAPFGYDDGCEALELDGNRCIDDVLQDFTTLKQQNLLLSSKGYQGRFNRYDDGLEFIYSVPFKDEQDLVRILKDFSFNDVF
jgi:hypothetical protein